MAIGLVLVVALFFIGLMKLVDFIHPSLTIAVSVLFLFFGLANRTLIVEGRMVFEVLDKQGLDAGRKQLARIVGRDTSNLSAQQIRTATLETMAENLSDGVVAPLFYYLLAGVPGIMCYKMINTMDSMIGYKNDRYILFGRFAARLDDVANYVPARLTAFFMALSGLSWRALYYVFTFGGKHASPNAGYPEAALAGLLNARFGGPNVYHGQLVDKPYIGFNTKEFTYSDFKIAARTNLLVFVLCILTSVVIIYTV